MAVALSVSDQHKSSKKDKKQSELGVQVSESGESKRKKRRDEEAAAVAASERPAKKKKVEQKDPDADDAMDSADNTKIELAKSKRPKRPKDKTAKAKPPTEEPVSVLDQIHIADISIPYNNPLTDTSLPEFSRRGLAYAYQYAQHISLPSDATRAAQQPWKFNKGRQNWIVRNVTEPAIIPEQYLALAMIYIESIKGGARDALKKTCKTTKKEAKAAKTQAEAPQPKTADSESNSAPKKVAFASTDVPTVSEEKRKRAKRILKVLKGKIQARDA